MEIKTVSVTPAMARSYLAQNSHNRRMSPNRVMTLAAMMRSGCWMLNGETIIISRTGQLLDGQHRLAAVVEYGRPVEMLVATGAADDAFATINTGNTRSTSDILGINGVAYATIISASASILWRMFHETAVNIKVPPTYVLEIVDRYPEFQVWAGKSDQLRKITSGSAALAAFVYLDRIAKRTDLAHRLFDGLLTGESLSAGDPILTLRNRMVGVRSSGNKTSARDVWVVFARAISALEAGEPLFKFRNSSPSPRFDKPEMFDVHAERLTPSEQLLDLVAHKPTNQRQSGLRFLKVAA